MPLPPRVRPCPPFRLVPWDTDFLSCLKDGILALTEGRPGNAFVVFMHDRPRRYLTHLFRYDTALPRPCLLPRLFTVRELVSAFREEREGRPRKEARRLDQVALLSSCVRRLARTDPQLCRRLSETDEARFFPWGGLLADLLEECLTQGLEPDDLRYTEGEVAPLGAALLGSLGRIFQSYREQLDQNGLATAGFDAFTVASALDAPRLASARAGRGPRKIEPPRPAPGPTGARAPDTGALPRFLRGRVVFLAGFSTLTSTEESLFHFLWQQGAYIYLHADPALAAADDAGRRAAHWACDDVRRWIADWEAPVELACPPAGTTPRLHFFAGYDLHSQLQALRADLLAAPPPENGADRADPAERAQRGEEAEREKGARPPRTAEVAVVLPHSDALLPVLHHLPRKDCNISLGYPLERSLLFRLLETVLKLREQRRPDGTTHWRPLLDLARHPYLRLLAVPGTRWQGPGQGLMRALLRRMEHRLGAGGRHVDPHALAQGAVLDLLHSGRPDAARAGELADALLAAAVDTWAGAATLADAADALAALCELLLEYGGGPGGDEDASLWQRFPLDAEGLFRLVQQVIPQLRDNGMADTPLPWPLIQAMILELVRTERVPFEADPLTGLQVLGMLETRLLRFSRVHLVDATDDHLPGAPVRNPLLPDSLRAVLGLPDTRRRDQLAAYTFHRLLAGADDVYLYWQEGVQPSGLFEGKKQRSRLVEALIWREEQRRGRRLKAGEGPLRTAAPVIHPPARSRRCVSKTPAVRQAVEASLGRPWSPTRLDAYLTCPLRYYYEHICGLIPPEEANEGDDPAAVGELVHTVLREWYEPWKGKTVTRADLDEQALGDCFADMLATSGLAAALPPESAAMLRVAGPERLAAFLRRQPDATEILRLEERLQCRLEVRGRVRTLGGTLDRVDRRADATGEGAFILDYKTGRLKIAHPSVWTDEGFWESAAPDAPGDDVLDRLRSPDPEDDPLPLIAARLPSLQLPYYMYLYAQATGEDVLDAAFVALGEDGEEKPLFGAGVPEEIRDEFVNRRIPALIRLVLLHMELCPSFRPREGRHCDWCSWNNLCIIPDRER